MILTTFINFIKCEYCGKYRNNKKWANCIGIGLHSWTLKNLK